MQAPLWDTIIRASATLALGAFGGLLFHLLHWPLPWMLGSLGLVSAVCLLGVKLEPARKLYTLAMAILGVIMAAQFTPQTFSHLGGWAISLLVMPLYLLMCGALSLWLLRGALGWDRVSAFLAASPGSAAEMAAAAKRHGGDARGVIVSHSTRLVLVVMALPFALLGGAEVARGALADAFVPGEFHIDHAWLALAAAAGMGAAHMLKLPAAALMGPMLLAAALYGADLVHAQTPALLGTLAQIAIGSRLGATFSGASARSMAGPLLAGAALSVIFLSLGFVFALLLAGVTRQSSAALMLAYAPGGVGEMALVAQSMGLDPAFVISHQLWRVLILLLIAMPLFGLWRARQKTTPG